MITTKSIWQTMAKTTTHSTLLSALTPETAGKCQILGLASEKVSTYWDHKLYKGKHLHRHTLGVNRSQVSVLEEGDEVSLSSLLQRHDGGGLEAEVGLTTRCQHQAAHMTDAHDDDSP